MPVLATVSGKSRVLVTGGLFALLAGCGGGSSPISQADAVGNSVGEAISCLPNGCKESSSLPLSSIQTYYTVSQSGSDVHVSAYMGWGGNFQSPLLLSPGDTLSASIGSQTVQLADQTGQRTNYAADLSDGQAQPTVTVNFVRGGVLYSSSVVVPPSLAILSAPTSVTLASGSFNVELNLPEYNPLLLGVTAIGPCTRVDGSSFNASANVSDFYIGQVSGGTTYQVHTSDLDNGLNASGQKLSSPANLSLVQTCNLQIEWGYFVTGSTSSALSNDSSIIAQVSVTGQFLYNAQH